MESTQEQTIIQGGVSFAAIRHDGTGDTVTIRLLKIKEFPDYLRYVDQEEKLAEFLCSKEEGWAASLTVESLLEICEKGHDLNFENACRWGQRRAKVNEALLPIAKSGQAISRQFPQAQG